MESNRTICSISSSSTLTKLQYLRFVYLLLIISPLILCTTIASAQSIQPHTYFVIKVAFSQVSSLLMSAGEDGLVNLWDTQDQREIATIKPSGNIITTDLSPDGSLIAIGTVNDLQLWSTSTFNQITSSTQPSAVNAVAFSPDGQYIAVGYQNGNIGIFSTTSLTITANLGTSTEPIESLSYSPDGHTVASTAENGTVQLLDVSAQRNSQTLSTGFAANLPGNLQSFSTQMHSLAFYSRNAAQIWNTDTQTVTRTIPMIGQSLALSHNGKWLAIASQYSVYIWDVVSNPAKQIAVLTGNDYDIGSIAFSHDDQTVATGGWDTTVRLWSTTTFQQLILFGKPLVSVKDIAFSPDGSALAAVGTTNLVRLYSITQEQETASLAGHTDATESVVYSPSGMTLASADARGVIRIWDANSLAAITSLNTGRGGFSALAFSPDGSLLVFGSGSEVDVWKTDTWQLVNSIQGVDSLVRTVAFRPDGQTVATGGRDGVIRLWRALDGTAVGILVPHPDQPLSRPLPQSGTALLPPIPNDFSDDSVFGVAFSPDGHSLVSGSWDGTARLWDVESQQQVAVLPADPAFTNSVTYSPDGRYIAAGRFSAQSGVVIWDADTLAEISVLAADPIGANSIAFSPDGSILAAGGATGIIQLYDLNP
jgi:WD40 repeat protein